MTIAREPIKTQRLVLEPVGPEHAEATWTATESSLPELRPWLVWTARATAANGLENATEAPRAWEAETDYEFVIVDNETVIGRIGLHVRNALLPHGEIGYWIRTASTGRGLTTEAARAVRDFAFDVVGLKRLSLRAGVANAASRRVAEKAGFQTEGTMREGGHGAEAPYDCILYGMLAADPRP